MPRDRPRYSDAWPSKGVVHYPGYDFLVHLHVYLMREVWHEIHYSPTRPELLQSALAWPRQAAFYDGADGLRQAAYLFHGLPMNHGFAQGNKRTAYAATRWFLWENRLGTLAAGQPEIVTFCYAAKNEKWSADQIESWLRANSKVSDPA